MIEILRDPLWGILIGLCVLTVTLIQWPRKRIVWELVYAVPLNKVTDDKHASAEVRERGIPTSKIHDVVIELRNSGNVPVEVEHFQRPLTFRFGRRAHVLAAEIAREEPSGIRAYLENRGNEVVVKPVLLNPGDVVCIKARIFRFTAVSADGRIVGHRRLKRGSAYVRIAISLLLFTIAMSIAAVLTLLGISPSLKAVNPSTMIYAPTLMLILMFGSCLMDFREALRFKRRRPLFPH